MLWRVNVIYLTKMNEKVESTFVKLMKQTFQLVKYVAELRNHFQRIKLIALSQKTNAETDNELKQIF